MRYWRDGRRLVRAEGSDFFAADQYNWLTRQWEADESVGSEVRWSGNFEPCTAAEAAALIGEARLTA